VLELYARVYRRGEHQDMRGRPSMVDDLWYGTKGNPDAPIVIVGESWGQEEKAAKQPFVGPSGRELHRMLNEAGISQWDCLFTNLIAEQPVYNETFRFFTPKSTNPNTKRVGGLIPGELARSEVQRLYRQLAHRPRRLVIGAGNWSLWGLSHTTGAEVQREANGRRVPIELQTYSPNGIMNWRGSMIYVEPHKELDPNPNYPWSTTKLLPIIYPAAIIRQWDLRAPTMHDLKTRVRQALCDDWRRTPTPTAIWNPTFAQAKTLLQRWLDHAKHRPIMLANDIETLNRKFISCMGFSDGPNFALTIPFISPAGKGESYWPVDQEAELIGLIRRILSHPNIRIVGQNYIYDTQYIQHWLGVTPNLCHDTMLAQNVLFPGTPKDLGYLSSLYCDYHRYWKDDEKDYNVVDERLLGYNCEDVMRTWEIAYNQIAYADRVGQNEQMAFKMKTNSLCLRMMNRGILMDQARAGSMYFELEIAQTAFYRELLEIIPQDWIQPITKKTDKPWYRSPKQTATLFYDILGFAVVTNKKTGNRTVGKEALTVLERKYPEFTGLFRRLDYAGSITNTMHVVKTPIEADGRMRCSYNPGGTETHRLSSSENVFGRGTNLQNLTKGEEDE
jgi:hypothetical protein